MTNENRWMCPICKKEVTGSRCLDCGYAMALSFYTYPSLAPLSEVQRIKIQNQYNSCQDAAERKKLKRIMCRHCSGIWYVTDDNETELALCPYCGEKWMKENINLNKKAAADSSLKIKDENNKNAEETEDTQREKAEKLIAERKENRKSEYTPADIRLIRGLADKQYFPAMKEMVYIFEKQLKNREEAERWRERLQFSDSELTGQRKDEKELRAKVNRLIAKQKVDKEPKYTSAEISLLYKMAENSYYPAMREIIRIFGAQLNREGVSVTLHPGDSISFGETEYGDLMYWTIIDTKEDTLLLHYEGDDVKQKFNNSYKNADWENCKLRSWLNNEFIKRFRENERRFIIKADIETNGHMSQDQLFCLSVGEIRRYMALIKKINRIWLLRDEGDIKGRVSACKYSEPGNIGFVDVRYEALVRPAMYVSSDYFTQCDNIRFIQRKA